MRGNPDPASDLDIWVIHLEPMRQRIQRLFNTVPAEIFVNPPWVIQNYFTQDQLAARPITAHMLATGFVVLAVDPVVDELCQKAQWFLRQPPDITPESLDQVRYRAAMMFEDATDVVVKSPLTSSMLLSQAVVKMLHFGFMEARKFIPRDKDLLRDFEGLRPDLAPIVQKFLESPFPGERMQLAGKLADGLIGVRGFFEWSSQPEARPAPGDTSK